MKPEMFRTVDPHALYEVSNYGASRSWCNNRHGKGSFPKRLSPTRDSGGYPTIRIKGVTKRIHVLVMAAFGLEKPTSKHEIAHEDGNPQNNHIDNLRWATRKENLADMVKHGTRYVGEDNHASKLTVAEVIEIRELAETGLSHSKIAKLYNVSVSRISYIKNRIDWKHV